MLEEKEEEEKDCGELLLLQNLLSARAKKIVPNELYYRTEGVLLILL